MTQELKPCPFCGGKPELVDDRVGWFVRCNHCKPYATVILGKYAREIDTKEVSVDDVDWDDIKQSAIDAWNKRFVVDSTSDKNKEEQNG